jgi:DNA-binding GntR family transcriptional regulator
VKEIVRPQTLTSAVVDAIRDSILRGDVQPGEPLREVELGQLLNTSRGTIREALRQLQSQGLVEVIPYRGAFVTQLSTQKIKEISSMRSLLEPYAVRLAMENRAYTDDVIDSLRQLIQTLAELESAGNYSELISTDIEFHRLLVEGCQHELLLHMLEELRALTYLFIFHTKLYHSDRADEDITHTAILQSILSGDPAHAERVVKEHILEAGESLIKRLDEMQQAA